jgi:hypothetical protein
MQEMMNCTAQKKNKSRKAILSAVGTLLRLPNRNLKSINKLLYAFSYANNPLEKRDFKYPLVINPLCKQQKVIYDERKHTFEDRNVSINHPYVRPIVRGKTITKVEFGTKIHVSIIDSISFLYRISLYAFSEVIHMVEYLEKYKVRFGCSPRELLPDKIYSNNINRVDFKNKRFQTITKPIGRPSAVQNHVSPRKCNPIDGKFGQAETAYGLDHFQAILRNRSESWITSIILELNLIKLAGAAPPCTIRKWRNGFSSKDVKMDRTKFAEEILNQLSLIVDTMNPMTVTGKI